MKWMGWVVLVAAVAVPGVVLALAPCMGPTHEVAYVGATARDGGVARLQAIAAVDSAGCELRLTFPDGGALMVHREDCP